MLDALNLLSLSSWRVISDYAIGGNIPPPDLRQIAADRGALINQIFWRE